VSPRAPVKMMGGQCLYFFLRCATIRATQYFLCHIFFLRSLFSAFSTRVSS